MILEFSLSGRYMHNPHAMLRSIRSEVFYKKGFLKISKNSKIKTCARVSSFL